MLYERIISLCKERKMTIPEVTRLAGLPNNTIYNWRTSSPSVDKVVKVAQVLNTSTDYLLGLSNNPNPYIKSDESIISIQRARNRMSDKDKDKMDAILRLAFENEFKE